MSTFPRALVLTGMHRSGTSLIARFLKMSGVDMGEVLLGEDPSNPYGHFEDMEILNFHLRVLGREFQGEQQWVPRPPRITEDDRCVATAFIARRRGKGHPWGWKEPRTCLFLNFWAELLPEAKFLFVFRHPWLVVNSLARRHSVSTNDRELHNRFLAAWILYNGEICRFYAKHRDCSVIFSLDSCIERPHQWVRLLVARLGYPFIERSFAESYDSSVLRLDPKLAGDTSVYLRMRASWVYRRLLALSQI